MEKLELKLRNIKCDGCVTSIKNAITAFDNIEAVSVNKETGLVKIYGKNLTKKILIEKLAALGYPEKSIFN